MAKRKRGTRKGYCHTFEVHGGTLTLWTHRKRCGRVRPEILADDRAWMTFPDRDAYECDQCAPFSEDYVEVGWAPDAWVTSRSKLEALGEGTN